MRAVSGGLLVALALLALYLLITGRLAAALAAYHAAVGTSASSPATSSATPSAAPSVTAPTGATGTAANPIGYSTLAMPNAFADLSGLSASTVQAA
jgi:hypothetical protein